MGRAMLSKSLIQFSINGWGSVPYLLFDLRPNYGGGDEDYGNLPQKVPWMHCHTQCPWHCCRPPLTHTSAGDCWTLTGKAGSVSCGVTAPFFWVLVHTRYVWALWASLAGMGFDPWVGKGPWRRKWQPTPVFLPGKSCGKRNLVGYSPWGLKE